MSVLIDDGKAEEEDIMKCDIGELVDIIEKLKRHLAPVVKVGRYGISISRWERPLVTIISMFTCCTIFIVNPVYMIICILLPIPPWLVIEYARTCGKRKVPRKIYSDYIQQKDEAYQQLLKQAALEKRRENLNMFLDNLIGLQRIFIDTIDYFEQVESVITWKRKRWSLFFLLASLVIEFMLYLLDVRIVLCFVTLWWFLVNRYFLMAIKNSISSGKTFVVSLYHKPKRLKVDVVKSSPPPPIILEEKVETMQPEDIDTSSTSETDDDTGDSKKEASTRAPRNPPAGSLMSMFIPRSLRTRYSRNCSKCDHPASTILKKRRYCRHCGNSFCSRCCNIRVPRSFLGATAPAAYQEKVLVCEACHVFLTNRMTTPSELVE